LHAESLSGIVRDPSGATVSGAAVSAHRAPSGAPLQTTTDSRGRFQFDAAQGSYTIKVTKDGFNSWETTVTMEGKAVDLKVSLKLKLLTETVTSPCAAAS
jgi:hypothetical protein